MLLGLEWSARAVPRVVIVPVMIALCRHMLVTLTVASDACNSNLSQTKLSFFLRL